MYVLSGAVAMHGQPFLAAVVGAFLLLFILFVLTAPWHSELER